MNIPYTICIIEKSDKFLILFAKTKPKHIKEHMPEFSTPTIAFSI